jgi:hypothetical protein
MTKHVPNYVQLYYETNTAISNRPPYLKTQNTVKCARVWSRKKNNRYLDKLEAIQVSSASTGEHSSIAYPLQKAVQMF